MNILFEKEKVVIEKDGQVQIEIPLGEGVLTESYLYSSFNLLKELYKENGFYEALRVDEDGLYIYDNQEEVVMWNYDELLEDTEVVMSAINAMKLLHEEGVQKLKEILKK